MEKYESSKVKHDFVNSISAIKTIAYANTILIKTLNFEKQEENNLRDKNLLLIKKSMKIIIEELSKIEEIFHDVVERKTNDD